MKLKLKRDRINVMIKLLVLYLIFIFCFFWVIRDLYAFTKASEGGNFHYSFNFLKLLFSSLFVTFNVFLITILKLKDFIYSVLVLILVFFVFPSSLLFAGIKNVDGRILL